MCISVKTLKTLIKLGSNVALGDIFPMLILHSWQTFRLLSPVLSGWISIMTVKAYWCHLFHKVCCSCATCHSCMLSMYSLLRCMNDMLHKSNKLHENKWHQYAFTVIMKIQPLNTGDKSLKVHQEYNSIGKISLSKRNITAQFF